MSGSRLWSGSATILAMALFVLAVGMTVLNFQNRSLQSEVNQRQQFINQSAQFSQVNQALVKLMATASIKNAAIKQMLVRAGFNVVYEPPPPPSASDPVVSTSSAK
jgi:LPS O-antigen subunit length determinant protein (WzzB/FepE family)